MPVFRCLFPMAAAKKTCMRSYFKTTVDFQITANLNMCLQPPLKTLKLYVLESQLVAPLPGAFIKTCIYKQSSH